MDGGVATVLALDDGVDRAEIELLIPTCPPVELVAPADAHTRADG